ncbi:MAG TPA: hypothetical protein VFO34_00635, partial [Candidatus Acidoferrales bacterium]|nr:hypothetical protein [Candidatus Acidoferrales bacterium]
DRAGSTIDRSGAKTEIGAAAVCRPERLWRNPACLQAAALFGRDPFAATTPVAPQGLRLDDNPVEAREVVEKSRLSANRRIFSSQR